MPLFFAVGGFYVVAAEDGTITNKELVHISGLAVAYLVGLRNKLPENWDGEDRRGPEAPPTP